MRGRATLLAACAAALWSQGCRAPQRALERLDVQDTPAARRLEAAGLSHDALREAAIAAFGRAPGFVPAERAGARATRLRAGLTVEEVEALVSPGGSAVAQVAVTVELARAGGGDAVRAPGRAAEPVGPEPGALRGAVERAARAAIAQAADGAALDLAAGDKTVRELVEDLGSPDPRLRLRAAGALGERGEPAAVPALVKALGDRDGAVVERAVGALAQLRDPRAVPALIALAHRREGPYLATMARILGDIGGDDARAWLLTMASGHPDEVVRGAARQALAEMGSRAPRR